MNVQVEIAKAEEEAAEAEWAATVAAQEAWEAAEAERLAATAARGELVSVCAVPGGIGVHGGGDIRTAAPKRRQKSKLGADAAKRRQSAPAQVRGSKTHCACRNAIVSNFEQVHLPREAALHISHACGACHNATVSDIEKAHLAWEAALHV